MPQELPKVLIIDDLFGRVTEDGTNSDRASLCTTLRIQDVTIGEGAVEDCEILSTPVCEGYFCRGQIPICSAIGTSVINSVEMCVQAVEHRWGKADAAPWSMLLLDLCFLQGTVTAESNSRERGMPPGFTSDRESETFFGLELLKVLHRQFPELPIVILSTMPRKDVADEFNRHGALGFIDRKLENASQKLVEMLNRHALIPDSSRTIIGISPQILMALQNARMLAASGYDVMLRGEMGTGKELFAKYLHAQSKTQAVDRPFVPVSSALFTPELFQSELYGIMPRVASEIAGRQGLLDSANGGDIFLDEIGDMKPDVQASMLRFLETRMIRPVGALSEHKVDLRVIAATEIAIEDLESGFRESLSSRFGSEADWVFLPPLRERLGDIELLAKHFLLLSSQKYNARERLLLPETLDAMHSYEWPGNVRELARRIDRAVRKRPDAEAVSTEDLEFRPHRSRKKNELSKVIATTKGNISTTTDREMPGFDDLLNLMRNIEFPEDQLETWREGLSKIELEMSSLRARMLSAAIGVGRTDRLSGKTKQAGETIVAEYRMLIDVSTGQLPNGNQNSNTQVRREIEKIVKNAPESLVEQSENLSALKKRLWPDSDTELGGEQS